VNNHLNISFFNSNRHDALDRIVWQRTARGDTTFSKFDSLGRLWKTIEGDRVTTRNYIASGPNVGRLESIIVNNGTAQIFVYDELGRITKFKDVLGSDTLITRYAYCITYGNLITYTFPSNFRLSYSFNRYGFKYQIADDTQVIWQLDSVNAFGQELGSRVLATNYCSLSAVWRPELPIVTFPIEPPSILYPPLIRPPFRDPGLIFQPALTPATRVRTNQFNIFGKPTRMTVEGLMDFRYKYNDSTGNMTFRENRFSGTNDTFGFDDLNRLTTGVTFDASGNITWKEGVGRFAYCTERVHAVVSISQPLRVGRDHSITYTPFQKVNSIHCSYTRLSAGFVYGPTHLRRQMAVVFYDHTLIRNYTQNVDISIVRNCCQDVIFIETKEYIFSPFGLVAIRNNGTVNAVATDHLGSIVAEFNPRRNTFEFFGYTAWGRRYRYDGSTGEKHFFDENFCLETVLRSPHSILDFFARGFDFMWENSFDEMGRPIRETSAWILRNGHIIVLPWSNNTPFLSQNHALRPRYCQNGIIRDVLFNGQWLPVATHAHTHPAQITLRPSDADHQMFERLNTNHIIILQNHRAYYIWWTGHGSWGHRRSRTW